MSSTTTHTTESFWSRVIAFAADHTRMSRLSALSNLSDEDMAARHATREREMQRILGGRYY